ncbi:Uncharacterised protein [Mycobacteroides abscessus subsp. abscessus]|nr:Uncharacterised protein [Mycobacteroides abscessus subsp. abscessus]
MARGETVGPWVPPASWVTTTSSQTARRTPARLARQLKSTSSQYMNMCSDKPCRRSKTSGLKARQAPLSQFVRVGSWSSTQPPRRCPVRRSRVDPR